MDDVLREIVLAGGDENLGAGNTVAAIALLRCVSPQQSEIGAAVRLGQVHGPGPAPRDHRRHVGRLLLRRAMAQKRGKRALGQARIHREGHVGRAHHLVDDHRQRLRQALPAEVRWCRDPHPTAVGVLLERRLEPLWRSDAGVGVASAALHVADPIEWRQHVLAVFGGLGQDRLAHVRRSVGKSGQIVVAPDLENVVQQELHLFDRSLVRRHGSPPLELGRWTM
jgi:hypothetical protein